MPSARLDLIEAQLLCAESVARDMVARLPDAGVVIVDAGMRVRLLTGDVYERLGWKTGDRVGRPLSEVLPEGAWQRLAPRYTAVLAGRRLSFAYTSEAYGRDYRVEMSPIGDSEVVGVLTVVQDASSDREQRARDRRMTTALQSLKDAVLIIGLDGRIIELNPAACRLLERDEDELREGDWWSRMNPRDADGQSLGPGNSPGASVASTGQPLRDVELTIATGDGRDRTVLADYEPLLSAEGTVDGLAIMLRDVTEARALQARERALLTQVNRVFEGSPAGMALMERGGDFERVNPAMCDMLGRSAEEALALNWRDIIHPDDLAATLEQAGRIHRREATTLTGPRRYVRADGEVIPVLVAVTAVPDPDGEVAGFFCEFHDLSAALNAQHARSVVLESALDAVVTIDETGRITEFNPAAERMFGRSRVDVMGMDVAALIIPPKYRDAHRKALRALAEGAPPRLLNKRLEFEAQRADGSLFPMELTITRTSASPSGYIAFIRDLSEAKRAEDLLASTIAGLGEGVFVTDADNQLVLVNDAAARMIGWTGDELRGRRMHDTVHYQHEDGSPYPFSDCIVPQVLESGVAVHFHEDVFTRKDGSTFPISMSVSPVETGDGRGGVVVSFRDVTEQKAEEERLRADLGRMEMITSLYEAIEDDRFVLHAQPIFDLATREAVSDELLIRMVGRDGELVPPGDFLPIAETHEVMTEIDRWVTRRAAALAATGRDVAVNLSGRSVGSEAVLRTIEEALTATGADPHRLTFEITETAVAGDLSAAIAFSRRLTDLGCGFALDDFGTGYGTLTYLKSLPVSYIKIDLEFVRDLTTSEASRKVVEVIVGMAETFGLKTIAEGVETQETLQRLLDLGVDRAQGFLLGRPGPV